MKNRLWLGLSLLLIQPTFAEFGIQSSERPPYNEIIGKISLNIPQKPFICKEPRFYPETSLQRKQYIEQVNL